MINLIPNTEKKEMIKSFYYRLAVLFLLVFGGCVFVLLVSILPSYFISYVKVNTVNSKLETQKNEPVPSPDEHALSIMKELNKKINLIENAESSQFLVSEKVIKAVLLHKTSNIKITDISYEDDSTKGRKISIEGIAPSREVLLSFRLALENDKSFKQVDLPISNFVKGSNIKFYLSLMPS